MTDQTTDTEPDPRFGPQTEHVEALLARAKTLSEGELERLSNSRPGVWDSSSDIAGVAAYDAALAIGRAAELIAAGDAAQGVAWCAVRGLAVRDLIGGLGFTQAHYDALTSAWRRTVGPLGRPPGGHVGPAAAVPGAD